ncbi:hypothetical protein BE20_25425 [Sorangium cellulosum]|uniref:Uncharacterized protein n=1 Tax=Sorangium cellulosum TaxID=56 RepID=A0A150S5B3_SORCE|nr:hypothetical protein BE18_15040 [Sorangium cellulosum]KYF87632.1 hypothetical protein BE20_25425 [Sorangium cellulosum]
MDEHEQRPLWPGLKGRVERGAAPLQDGRRLALPLGELGEVEAGHRPAREGAIERGPAPPHGG